MSLIDSEGNVRARFAEARRRAYEQLTSLHPEASFDVGLVLLSIRHDATSNYETTYPLYLEVRRNKKAKLGPMSCWEEYLALQLHTGCDPDERTQRHWLRTAKTWRSQNPTALDNNWDTDWYPKALDDDASAYFRA